MFPQIELLPCFCSEISIQRIRIKGRPHRRKGIHSRSIFEKLKRHFQDWSLTPDGWHIAGSDKTYNLEEVDPQRYHETQFYKERRMDENDLKQRIIVTFLFKYKDYPGYVRNRQIERATPTYTRTDFTNNLHGSAGFRTDA